MLRLTRKLALALVGASALVQLGAIVPSVTASSAEPRVLVNAPEPTFVSEAQKAPPPGITVKHMSRQLLAAGAMNHVQSLSNGQIAELTKQTGVRDIVSRSGFFSGAVTTPRGEYRFSIVDGVLASGRHVVAFGTSVPGQTSQSPSQVGGLIVNAEAATFQFLGCSYATVDPATNNLFLYICPRDVGPIQGLLGVAATVVGILLGGVVGGLIGAVVGAAIIIGVWRITNNDGSISLTLPSGVWQPLSGWFQFLNGQYVYVNGNPCLIYYENVGWIYGCQLPNTFNWVATDFNGRLEPFVIGGGNHMYSKAQLCNPNCGWTGWMDHGGYLVQRPALASDVNGELNAIGVGSGGNLMENYQSSPGSGSWVYWYTLGCCFTGHVAIGRNTDGRLEAVVRNSNGNIDHFWETSQNGSWNGYGHLMCCFASSPTIESNTDGRLEVFAIDNYKNLYHIWQVQPNGGWSGIQSLGCCLIGNPQAGRFADGSLVVFGIGTDHNLYYQRQTSAGGGWSGWRGLGGGGNLVSDPVVRQNYDGRLEVFVIDSNNHLRDVFENSPNGGWSWGDLGCCVKGNPDAQINTNGILEVFAVGMDNALYHKWQSTPGGGPWSAWSYLAGVITVTP
jgi:hypothetical protein